MFEFPFDKFDGTTDAEFSTAKALNLLSKGGFTSQEDTGGYIMVLGVFTLTPDAPEGCIGCPLNDECDSRRGLNAPGGQLGPGR